MSTRPGIADTADRILDLLDQWRHLPDYQLERRADILFALFLPEFLSHRLNLEISGSLIPEFPVRIGTIDPQSDLNTSCKIDYLALSATGRHAIFVELKTDSASRRQEQDRYLQAAKAVGLRALLEGLLQIVRASAHKHKYCRLLRLLEGQSLLALPASLEAALASRHYASGVNACLRDVIVTASEPEIIVLYLQPRASRPDEIGFDEFADWLESREGAAARFARSLRQWATVGAGHA